MSQRPEPRAAEALRDVSSRIPRYAKLSAALAREGVRNAATRSPLQAGGLAALGRWVPQLRQLNHALTGLVAIRTALNEMQSEKAERHLESAGLTREQIERDVQTITAVTRRMSDDGARNARRLMHKGAHHAGLAAGKGVRALRRWLSDDDSGSR